MIRVVELGFKNGRLNMPSAKRAGHLIMRKMFMLKRCLDTAKVEHVAALELDNTAFVHGNGASLF